MILFINNFLITSHNGTHIFSENSLTVIISHIVILSFFIIVLDALAGTFFLGALFLFSSSDLVNVTFAAFFFNFLLPKILLLFVLKLNF
jgi:hypothetical protein